MRGLPWTALVLLAMLPAWGCGGPSRRTLANSEPGLNTEPGVTVVERPKPVPRSTAFASRHPLFSKPREYYENSGNNKVTKAAAATVLGVPAGIYGELKQIVVGVPPAPAQ